jgi:hypothetical protein
MQVWNTWVTMEEELGFVDRADELRIRRAEQQWEFEVPRGAWRGTAAQGRSFGGRGSKEGEKDVVHASKMQDACKAHRMRGRGEGV